MSVCRVSPLQCPLDCSGRGNCVNGVCMCTPPLLPPDCATAACPNGCSRNGYCLNGTCFCRPGFEGADCVFNGSRSRPRECAVVSLSSAQRVLASFFHPAGSKGGCPNGCGGHGHCVHGACYCEPGWRGRSCEVARCPNGCSGNGVCNVTPPRFDPQSPVLRVSCVLRSPPPCCARARKAHLPRVLVGKG